MSGNQNGTVWASVLVTLAVVGGLYVVTADNSTPQLTPPVTKPQVTVPAPAKAAVTSEPAKPVSNWSVRTGKSDVDDSPYVVLSVESIERPTDRYGRMTWPTLYVRCQENTTSLIVNWGRYLGINETSVTYRIDDNKAVTRNWSIATNHEAVGLWRGNQSIPVIKQVLGSKLFLTRITPYGDNPITVRFDTTGLDKHIGALRKACNW
ncbi:type VI secretion system-associated protein TagO [Zobellella sp. DQSA1]|uniref:type VI secretion system-associated protein TagO n=1 Tax=Zobellella sp. DQSA1 TaxID=3342386 RepID=UPI0035C043DB